MENRELEMQQEIDELSQKVEELERVRCRLNRFTSEVVWAFASAVDAKNSYTNGHSGRVADYSWMIAKRLGRDKSFQRQIYCTALLHDVGKIGIPDSVLDKPSKLTDDEYQLIKDHTVIGGDILNGITIIPSISVGARYHHERYDGKGYPEGLKGDEIPEMARIIAVADTYDAMTSKRTYNEVVSQKTVRDEMLRCRGTQLDPEITDVMIEIIDEDTQYRFHG